LGQFRLQPEGGILITSRSNLPHLLSKLSQQAKRRLLIVHDEVHGLGTPTLRLALENKHTDFSYRLGLSATPERAYDEEGNEFLEKEIGPTIYEFPLEAAIARGVLSEFDYLPIPYVLTDGDRKRLKAVYQKKVARARSGNPMTKEEMWMELARVYKTAEDKIPRFADYVGNQPEILKSTILFVETKEYGARILPILHKHTHLYRTYFADDDRDALVAFANGETDCLITCHRLSQGIDIPALKHVILFSAARSKLETIQRIGRCLRTDPENPDKRAVVVDFVRDEDETDAPNADSERKDWLSGVASTRQGDSNWH
jgi:superfamily II DNA or RNA helicase